MTVEEFQALHSKEWMQLTSSVMWRDAMALLEENAPMQTVRHDHLTLAQVGGVIAAEEQGYNAAVSFLKYSILNAAPQQEIEADYGANDGDIT